MSYKKWSLIAVFLFAVGLVLGLVTPPGIAGFMSEDIAALEELSRILTPFSVLTFSIIFVKNASALVLSFVLSPILCLMPLITLTVNGWLLAFVSSLVVQEESLGFVLAGVLPHGIFELPAIIIGEAAALSFGAMAILALFRRDKRPLLLPNIRQNLKYLLVAVALLLPAAIIETYLTPLLIS